MGKASDKEKLSPEFQAKEFACKATLLVLGTAFELVSKHSPELREEIAGWRPGLTFSMGIMPNGPYMTVKREGDLVKYLGWGLQNPDITILFKNFDAAMLAFTAQIGNHTAVAQKRFIVQGNVGETVKIARALNMVQSYLFPSILFEKLFKRPPEFTTAQLWAKAKVMAGLTPGLLLNALK